MPYQSWPLERPGRQCEECSRQSFSKVSLEWGLCFDWSVCDWSHVVTSWLRAFRISRSKASWRPCMACTRSCTFVSYSLPRTCHVTLASWRIATDFWIANPSFLRSSNPSSSSSLCPLASAQSSSASRSVLGCLATYSLLRSLKCKVYQCQKESR